MSGIGLFPAGYGIYGSSGTPDELPVPSFTNGAAFVNQNGDYEDGGSGDVVKTTSAAQRVMLLLRTVKGSVVADATLGVTYPTAVDASFETRMRYAVQDALSPATLDGSISIDSIKIERTMASRASITVVYTVTATGEQEIVMVI